MIHVLLVDDEDINNFITKRLIDKTGFEAATEVCKNGADALAFLARCSGSENKTFPDVILIDINMPVMTGWELLDELKLTGLKSPDETSVYLLSSSVYEADITRSKNYPQLTSFLTKPITLEILKEIFQQIKTPAS